MSTYAPFIRETPGRQQPYAVWYGMYIYHFFTTREAAEHYINTKGAW